MPIRTKNAEPAGDDSVLPPGQRDRTGFWLPLGCDDPRDLVRRRGRRAAGPRRKQADERDGASAS